ncbi:MAG: AAA family ATPase [Chlamydiota bacterium]
MFRIIEDKLKSWKEDPFRIPLLLRGARQVGKSYLVEEFGKNHFVSIITINFDANPEYCSCFENLDPQVIIQKIELLSHQPITPGKTLLFLDEIQNCPKAIMALRYFKEKCPLLHVIAAGSLLEFTIQKEDFSFPVGRVQFLYVRPLSFKEFLIANNTLHLPKEIEKSEISNPITGAIHDHLMNYVKQYYLVGGMPAPISVFLQTKSFLKSQEIHAIISQTYQSDFGKYAKKREHIYLQLLFEKIPNLIGQQFKYSKIDSEVNSRDLKSALSLLIQAGIIHKVHATSADGIPLPFHKNDNKFKVLFLDIGLIQQVNQIEIEKIWTEDLTQINAGRMAEQFVGQELIAYGEFYEQKQLFFWDRVQKGSEAEVDYLISLGSHIFPIEVKAGKTGKLRSLQLFMKEKKSPLGIQICQSPLSFQDKILTVPFYMIDQIPRLVKEALAYK